MPPHWWMPSTAPDGSAAPASHYPYLSVADQGLRTSPPSAQSPSTTGVVQPVGFDTWQFTKPEPSSAGNEAHYEYLIAAPAARGTPGAASGSTGVAKQSGSAALPAKSASKGQPGAKGKGKAPGGNPLALLSALRSKGEALLCQKQGEFKQAVQIARTSSPVVSIGEPQNFEPSSLDFQEAQQAAAYLNSLSDLSDPEVAHNAMVLKQTLDRFANAIGKLDVQIATARSACPGSAQPAKSAKAQPAAKKAGQTGQGSSADAAWKAFCSGLAAQPWAEACAVLNQHLQCRTYLASRERSDVDQLAFAAVKGLNGFDYKPQLELEYPHFCRWFLHCSAFFGNAAPAASAGASNAGKSAQQPEAKSNPLDKLKPLENAVDGQVVTRFPPEPSGYLHLGHVKACLLNEGFARKYNGKLIFRLDDTNPDKEEQEFADSMVTDLNSLGIVPDMHSATSDWFDQLLEAGYQVVRDGKAYCDKTPQLKMQEERAEGIDSEFRNNSIEENIRLMDEMCKGTPEGLLCCVRGKMGMHHKNKALRDPVFFRCKAAKHHRLGSRWNHKIFPCYDFACPLVDSWEGVTHALRDSNYTDRDLLYTWVCEACKIRCPDRAFFSRLNFVYCELSKRKLGKLVKLGKVNGWDDPRMPTVQGVLNRGMSVEGLKDFIFEQASSLNITLQEWDKIWACNKAAIDMIVPRYTVVEKPVKVLLSGDGCPTGVELKGMPKHPKNPDVGEKIRRYTATVWIDQADAMSIKQDQEVTLVDWGNCIIESITGTNDDMVVKAKLNPTGNVKKTVKITWVAAMTDTVPCTLIELDHLLAKKELEDGDEIENCIREVTWTEVPAVGEHSMRMLKKGDKMQIMRKGYYTCYQPFISDAQPMRLIQIPDGKQKPMAKGAKEAKKGESDRESGKSWRHWRVQNPKIHL